MGSRTKRFWRGVAFFIAGVVAAGTVSWAVFVVARPAQTPSNSTDFTLVEVVPGEVGSKVRLNAVAEWKRTPIGTNRASGVVTGIAVEPGAEVMQGSVLYSVNLRPVVVARGNVPAFRDIGQGMSGPDVQQIQQLLTDLGVYRGEVGGDAGAATAAAIRIWQRSLGVDQTGVIQTGDIIFVPELPSRVVLNADSVTVGATLGGGEQVLSGLPAAPTVTIPATDAQAAMMPAGTRVEITSPNDETWQSIVGSQKREDTSDNTITTLEGIDGATLCGDGCGEIPITGQTTLSSWVITVETVTGLTLPSSALVSTADGQICVIDSDGIRIPVTVVAAAKGMSVIEGVEPGAKVRVPGQEVQ